MYQINTRIGNAITSKMLQIHGLSFTVAGTRDTCALFGLNCIDQPLQKSIHPPPVEKSLNFE